MTTTSVAIEKFTVAQLATAISSITGETVTTKSFNYKSKAVDRLKALITEHHLSNQDVLQAAGIEAITPTGEAMSGIGIGAGAKPPKTKRKPRDSKRAKVIEMLKRDGGATITQITEVTGWQPHTVRGAISGALKKKLGYNIVSRKLDTGERIYRIEA
ncbi:MULTISPECIES: DUF3489 domain-containing protein [Thalassospira]|uniref:DUF3489 domain-containing protein n=1 Tax=Thalassospira TaxID=168934 RepID=UPI0002872586|nr:MULTISPECIES: DUF3489 domain-containing protein [Thalassospira]EKF09287.1 hypothetical protein TH2_05333 [Thalassospira profundimaris WP0211]MBC06192.1 DUF3489 domain-containing protein [Thalassospira sp.]